MSMYVVIYVYLEHVHIYIYICISNLYFIGEWGYTKQSLMFSIAARTHYQHGMLDMYIHVHLCTLTTSAWPLIDPQDKFVLIIHTWTSHNPHNSQDQSIPLQQKQKYGVLKIQHGLCKNTKKNISFNWSNPFQRLRVFHPVRYHSFPSGTIWNHLKPSYQTKPWKLLVEAKFHPISAAFVPLTTSLVI